MLFVKDLEQKGYMWRNGTREYKMEGLTHVLSRGGGGVGWGGGEQWQRDWLPINTWFVEFW